MRETQGTGETAREKMEDFVSREIPHYLVQDVYEMPPGLPFLTYALKLGLRIAECGSKRLKFIQDFWLQAVGPR